jgi:hypothetical protein
MDRAARSHRQRRPGRAVASLCRAGGTARARPAAIATRHRRHAHGPHGARAGGTARARPAAIAMRSRWHTHGPHGACPPPAPAGEGGRVAPSRGWHSACSSRRDRDAPLAAHTWAARRAPSASAGRGGRSRRGGCTARARPAAIATRRRRYTHGPRGACPPPSPAGGGWSHRSVARAAQHVLVPPRLRRAGCSTHMGRTARALRQRRLERAVVLWGRHSAFTSRRDRDAPAAAHTWTARRALSASAGWGGRPRCAGGTACVVTPLRRRAADSTHMGSTVRANS